MARHRAHTERTKYAYNTVIGYDQIHLLLLGSQISEL